MNINATAERLSPYFEKVGNFRIPGIVFHVSFLVSLLAFAVQGIPYLAVHAANVISTVQLGYYLTGGGAALLFATILWIVFYEK